MSMTPLQAIAATKFVNGEGISAHRMQSVADAYALHPLVQLMRQYPDIQTAVDDDFPVASGGVRASDAAFFAQFGSSTNTEDALVDYANHVLCNGDIGKFSSVVDKCSGLMTAIGDVTATIDKASTMNFSDLGPGVKNHGDAINMGLGASFAKFKQAMQDINNGKLPEVQGVPQTDAAVVGTVILAQGEVSGDSASPNFGTALGIYEAAKKKGLTDSIDAIHQEFLKQKVPVATKIKGTSGDYIRVAPTTAFTEEQYNELLDLTYAAAVEDELSANAAKISEAITVKAWVESRRAKGYDAFMTIVRDIALKLMNDPDKYSVDPFLKITADLTVRSNTHMTEAIDALPLDSAKKLFQGLGSKVQIEKLEKWTDILDVAKCSAAMPEPLTTENAPSSITSNTDVDPTPVTPDADATAKIEGSLATAKESLTSYQEAAKLKSNQADIAAGKPPSEWNVTPEQVANNTAISKGGLGALSSIIEGSLSTPIAIPTTATVDVSAIGSKALESANALKLSATAGVSDFNLNNGVDLKAFGGAGLNVESIVPSVSSMQSIGSDMGKIKGFGNMADMKSLGNMLRSVETSIPNVAGFGDSTKALVPTALNGLSGVMPEEIKEQLQNVVGTGTGSGGSYTLLDFVGSAVGENGQVEGWTNIMSLLDALWSKYQEELEFEIDASAGVYTAEVESIVTNMASSVEGEEAVAEYEGSIAKVKAEYELLTVKAGIDFATIPAGDLTSKLNLSKKLAQMAHKLDSGHAAVFQNAADPGSMGGQALLGVMVEARNTKLLQKAGLQPANVIESDTKTVVTDQDRAEAAKIQAKSGDPDAITAEQVARNRSLNNTLKGLFGI